MVAIPKQVPILGAETRVPTPVARAHSWQLGLFSTLFSAVGLNAMDVDTNDIKFLKR